MQSVALRTSGISSKDADINSKLKGLIIESTSLTEGEKGFKTLFNSAKRSFRSKSLDRVNQFAVRDRLDGLEERWRVSFEEELADDLQTRIHRMRELDNKGDYKFVPECLQFLLSLSTGRPNYNFKEALESAKVGDRLSETAWSETAQEGTGAEEGLWDNIDYTVPGSDDGMSPILEPNKLPGEKTAALLESTQEVDEFSAKLYDESKVTEDASLKVLTLVERTVQLLRQKEDTPIKIPEALVVRESIHMLCGMSAELFPLTEHKLVRLKDGVELIDLPHNVLRSLLSDILEIGDQCELARRFVRSQENGAVMRRYQALVEECLSEFYSALSNIEYEAIKPDLPHVSILRLSRVVSKAFQEIALMLSALPSAKEERREIRLLNQMVDIISDGESVKGSEMEGPVTNLMRCFDLCFATYWRPIEDWIAGTNHECKNIAFIEKQKAVWIAPDFFWARTFTLDKAQAPTFLRPYLTAIMSAGKTAAFLTKLTGSPADLSSRSQNTKVQEQSILVSKKPIFEPLQKRLDRLMQMRCVQKTQGLGIQLREELLQNWEFGNVLKTLQHVYLAQQGNFNDKAYVSIFRLMDRGSHWSDRFLLTDVYQRAFEGLSFISSEKLSVSIEFDERTRHARERSLVRLEAIRIQYALPWPIANLVDGPSLSVYQRVAKLLLQIARAKDCLDQQVVFGQNKKTNVMRTGTLLMSLLHRLRWFVNILHSYIAIDVVPGFMTDLQKSIGNCDDFDIMIQQFRRSVASLQRGCFLSASLASTHQALVSLLDLTVVLSDMRTTHALSLREDDLSSDNEDNLGLIARINVVEAGVADSAKLVELLNTYKQLLSFVHAGVKEASRSSGDMRLDLFAEDIAVELATIKRL